MLVNNESPFSYMEASQRIQQNIPNMLDLPEMERYYSHVTTFTRVDLVNKIKNVLGNTFTYFEYTCFLDEQLFVFKELCGAFKLHHSNVLPAKYYPLVGSYKLYGNIFFLSTSDLSIRQLVSHHVDILNIRPDICLCKLADYSLDSTLPKEIEGGRMGYFVLVTFRDNRTRRIQITKKSFLEILNLTL